MAFLRQEISSLEIEEADAMTVVDDHDLGLVTVLTVEISHVLEWIVIFIRFVCLRPPRCEWLIRL